MKKKHIAIISCSVVTTVALLFASLIYCAISAFPELLENELENGQVKEATYDSPVVLKETKQDNNTITVSDLGGSHNFTPSLYESGDVIVISHKTTTKNNEVTNKTETIKETKSSYKGKEHFSGFYEYRENNNLKRSVKANRVIEAENSAKEHALEISFLVLVIIHALALCFLKNKKQEQYLHR